MFCVNASGFQIFFQFFFFFFFFFFLNFLNVNPKLQSNIFFFLKWKLGRFFSPIWNVLENFMKSLRRPFHIFLDIGK